MTKDSISSMRHAIYLVLDCCNIPMTSGFLFQLLTMCQIYRNLAVIMKVIKAYVLLKSSTYLKNIY